MNSRPEISVVIPSLQRIGVLRDTLADLTRQTVRPSEVIVVAQDSETAGAAARFGADSHLEVVVERLPEASASAARNRGLLRASSDVVLFLDDDVRIEDPGFLEAHLEEYRDPETPGVAGQVLGPGQRPRDHRHPRSHHPRVGWLYFPRSFARRCTVREAPTSNLSVRRPHAVAIGGMDEQFEKGAHREDSDFSLRLTTRYGPLVFEPDASLVHLGEEDGGCRSWGANRGLHPIHHVTGEWYFILKNVRAGRILLRDLPDHLFMLVRRQILNRANVSRPWRVPAAALRSLHGFGRAVRKVRAGPRHLTVPDSSGAPMSPAGSSRT